MTRPGPKHLTPQMQAELQRRMQAGEPLPPGFVALPEGQAPPSGMVPAGVSAQHDGQPITSDTDLTKLNPMLKGQDAFTVMRNKGGCPLPEESSRLQKSIQASLAIKGHHEEVEKVLAAGLATALRVNSYCDSQLKERVAVDFKDVPELAEMSQQILNLTDEAEGLQEQIKKLQVELGVVVRKAQPLIEKRWDTAVKSHGLDPAKNVYCMSEDDNQIIDMRFDCATCKGKARIRKARQEGEKLLQNIAQEQRKTALKSVELDEHEEKTDG